MKGIDLTKCRNERARIRYRYDESRVYDATGYIEQVKDGWVHLVDDEDEGFIPLWHDGKMDEDIIDLEIIPRDPETYMDWQVGDKVTCPDEKWNNIATLEVIFRSGELVICKNEDGDISGGYTCSQLFRLGYRLVLTDIEKQIIKEQNWKPQDGDICYVEDIRGNQSVFISAHGSKTSYYVSYAEKGHGGGCLMIKNTILPFVLMNEGDIKTLRPATEEEKQELFDAMAKRGKWWNAEKKVVEDIPKPYEFKKGEPVLVRDNDENIWILSSFIQFIPTSCFHVTNGVRPSHWKQCIPYNERTMHVLGTAEDYKEE